MADIGILDVCDINIPDLSELEINHYFRKRAPIVSTGTIYFNDNIKICTTLTPTRPSPGYQRKST